MSRIKKVMQEQRFFQKLKAKKTHDPTINNALSITNGVSESTQTSIHTIFFYYMHKLADSVQSIYTVSNAYYIMYTYIQRTIHPSY
jgi:hypothetical protein